MIGDRIWLAPTWMRWLVQSGANLAFLVPWVVCAFPTFLHRAGWPWVLIASLVLSLVEGAVLLWAARPARRRQLAVLDGLSNRQRTQALAALRTGAAPADHAALVAAIKFGDLRRACRRGATRGQRLLVWCVPLLIVIVTIGEYVGGATRLAELFAVVAVISVIRSVLFERRIRRAAKNLDVLRAEAASSGLASQVADEGEVVVALPRRRAVMYVVAAAIPILLVVTVMLVVDRPRPDCDTVHELASFIYGNRQLEIPQSPTLGSLDVAAYQAWSDELQRFSRRVSNPAVAPRLRHIADLSVEAVSQVRASHSTPEGDTQSAAIAFRQTIGQLIDEDNAVMAYCF